MGADLAGIWLDKSIAGSAGALFPIPLEAKNFQKNVLYQYPDGYHVCYYNHRNGTAYGEKSRDGQGLGCWDSLCVAAFNDYFYSVRRSLENVSSKKEPDLKEAKLKI